MTGLSPIEYKRYARHIVMKEIGTAGQEKLLHSKVLIVGAGGLGSPIALYLTAAGVGTIGIADTDIVDVSNLQRQVIHGVGMMGVAKVQSAKERLFDLNPSIKILPLEMRIEKENALEIISEYDLVVDGTDNLKSRYVINEACVRAGVPYVYGAVGKFEGQVSVFGTKEGPCYQCAYPEEPPEGVLRTTEETGILGVLPGVIGSIQANEALKVLLGMGKFLQGRILFYDSWNASFRNFEVEKNPECPVCGNR